MVKRLSFKDLKQGDKFKLNHLRWIKIKPEAFWRDSHNPPPAIELHLYANAVLNSRDEHNNYQAYVAPDRKVEKL